MDRSTKIQSIWDAYLGQVNNRKHLIKLTSENTPPIHSVPYRVGPKAREFETAKFDKMLIHKVIEPIQIEWAPPIVFAIKKDGSLRFCVFYRKLNAVTIRDS